MDLIYGRSFFSTQQPEPHKNLDLYVSWLTSSALKILFATEVQQVSKQPSQIEIYSTGSYGNANMWFAKGITTIHLVKQQDNFSHHLSNFEISYIYDKNKKNTSLFS